jgi:DNA polymerase III delta prime subunit
MHDLWVEKYRPKTINEYVFRDEEQKHQVQGWIDSGTIPHLLFSGSPGVGKTTLAKVLLNEIGVNSYDILETNGSSEGRKIDWFRETLSGFCATLPFGEFKVVLVDEADYLNPESVQPAMRHLMETYASQVRFILTCNNPTRIIPALHSRCQGFHIDKIDKTEFTARVATVLITEKVDVDIDTLDSYVKATYPDLRKCINLVQMNTIDGKLVNPQESDKATKDYRLTVVNLFEQGKILEARKLLCNQVRPEEMDELFRWMYDNLELWSTTQDGKDKAVLIIAKGLRNIPMVADQEINLAATLIELCQIRE